MKRIITILFILSFAKMGIASTETSYELPRVLIEGHGNAYIVPTVHWYHADKLCGLFHHEEFVSIKTGVVTLGSGELVAYLNEREGGLIIDRQYLPGDKAAVVTRLTCR